jgi:hypothetical protein
MHPTTIALRPSLLLLSYDILRNFCFFGFACGLTCSLYSITSLLSPTKLEVDQAKTLMFLSRNCRSSACSSGLILVPIQTVLSGTLESSATLLKSPSALIDFLIMLYFLTWAKVVPAHTDLHLPSRNTHSCALGRNHTRCFLLLFDYRIQLLCRRWLGL